MLKFSEHLSSLRAKACPGKSQDATDLLHEDLVTVEQRVEPAKKAAQVIHKKLQGCLHGQGLDPDKRMKKLPLMMLSTSMAESLSNFDEKSSIRHVLEVCCVTESKLATVQADFELNVEKDVLEPLSKLCEEDLPEILKNKKQFAKLTTDWQNACNRSQAGSTAPQAKQDGLKEDAEEARRKLDAIKDQYSADLYHFATKEDDYANYFNRLLELQAEYHKHSHEALQRCISEIKENNSHKDPQSCVSNRKVFGEPLLSHLSQSSTDIAVPIHECVQMLLRTGMREEGLFRLAAAASVVKRLKASLNGGKVDHSEFTMEPHAVAGVLKCYLRELPEPLMTFDLYTEWFKAAGEKELTDKLEKFRELLKKLPPENYNNLRYLVQFLSLLSEQQSVNRMSPSNIAIVLGPNLLWPRTEEEISLASMASASSVQVVTVMEPLIQYCSSLFPEEASFEIPELPDSPILTQPVAVSPSPIPDNTKVTRTSSSSSTSSCSSHHLPLSKSNSTTSQDSVVFPIVKSGSVSRRSSGVTTWDNPTSESAVPTSPNQTAASPSSQPVPSAPGPLVSNPSSTASYTTAAQIPTPAPRAATSSNRKLSMDLSPLEPISEAPTESPKATVNIGKPLKPSRSFSQPKRPPVQPGEQFSKPRAPVPPKPPAPLPPSTAAAQRPPAPPPPHTTAAAQKADTKTKVEPPPIPPQPPLVLKKAPIKKPGIPPPRPPPSEQHKQVPSVGQ